MGKRSGILDHEADFMKGSLEDLDLEIARCVMMRNIATNTRNRKSLASRIHWLERVRSRYPAVNSN
jgi:hypothetical protein